jgi:exodeoxyribonuclease VIII
MTAEIRYDLPIGEYHRLERLSPSGMAALLRSPAHYQASREAWATREPSRALRIGSAVHTLVLEPELAATHILCPEPKPDADGRTKEGRPIIAEWRERVAAAESALHPDGIILTADEMLAAQGAADALLSHPGIEAAGLLRGTPEFSILWDEAGAPCKARPDLITERGFLVDIKTCADASDFARSVARYGYHRQDAWLKLAAARAELEIKGLVFLVVETSAPHGVRAVTLDSVATLQGEREVFRAVDAYRTCTESGEWPCYPPGLDTLSLPIWALDIEE